MRYLDAYKYFANLRLIWLIAVVIQGDFKANTIVGIMIIQIVESVAAVSAKGVAVAAALAAAVAPIVLSAPC